MQRKIIDAANASRGHEGGAGVGSDSRRGYGVVLEGGGGSNGGASLSPLVLLNIYLR